MKFIYSISCYEDILNQIFFIILLNRRPLDSLMFIIIKCKHQEAEHELVKNWLVKIYEHLTNFGQIIHNL